MRTLHSNAGPPCLQPLLQDLKTPNILVDDRWRVKITDFGLSRARQATYVSASGQGGTPEWMAPEVLCCGEVAEPADVYSYGVVLWELLSREAPWEGYNPMQVSLGAGEGVHGGHYGCRGYQLWSAHCLCCWFCMFKQQYVLLGLSSRCIINCIGARMC